MVIELRVVQFWSEIILVISNRTHAAGSFDFEITRMISDQIALHSVQSPLFIILSTACSWCLWWEFQVLLNFQSFYCRLVKITWSWPIYNKKIGNWLEIGKIKRKVKRLEIGNWKVATTWLPPKLRNVRYVYCTE